MISPNMTATLWAESNGVSDVTLTMDTAKETVTLQVTPNTAPNLTINTNGNPVTQPMMPCVDHTAEYVFSADGMYHTDQGDTFTTTYFSVKVTVSGSVWSLVGTWKTVQAVGGTYLTLDKGTWGGGT